MLRSGIVGLYVALFLIFLRTLYTVFHSVCTNLYSHQQCIRIPFSPSPYPYLFFFLNDSHWWIAMRYLILVLICIFLMISDIEHLSLYLWTFVCLWENVCWVPLSIFFFNWIGFVLFAFCCWIVWVPYVFWNMYLHIYSLSLSSALWFFSYRILFSNILGICLFLFHEKLSTVRDFFPSLWSNLVTFFIFNTWNDP